MKQRILITGISGFVGTHLTNVLLRNKKYQVYGTVLHTPKTNDLDTHIFKGDLINPSFLAKVVGESMPEYVIHLAAQASVAESLKNPRKTLEDNFFIELNL